MSPRTLTPLALAAMVLFAGSALAVPVSDHGPPSEADTEKESFALVPVYGPVLDDPVFTVLAQEPRADMVYGPDLNEDHYNLRVLPDNWHQLTDDAEDEDRRNPWADSGGAPLQNAPDSGGDTTVPCGCPSHDPGHSDDNNPSGPSDGDDAPNTGEDGDDVDNDDGMDGDDSDGDDSDADDSDADGDDSDGDDADGDDSDADDSDSDDTDSDDADADDSDGDDSDSDDSDDSNTAGN